MRGQRHPSILQLFALPFKPQKRLAVQWLRGKLKGCVTLPDGDAQRAAIAFRPGAAIRSVMG